MVSGGVPRIEGDALCLERLAGVGCTVALMERETSISKHADRRKHAESRSCCAEMTSDKNKRVRVVRF